MFTIFLPGVVLFLGTIIDWHARLGGGILADSILDRVIHRTIPVYSGDINMREFLATHEL